jgi:hypothetical protein
MRIQNSKRTLTIAAVLLVAAGASGCAGDPIRSDYDPTADFSQYSTYNFFADAGPEDTNYQSFFSQYMVAAITREMEMRGYSKSNDPDLLVNFNAILQEKTDVRTTPAPSYGGGYYGYRGGFYDPWGGYGYGWLRLRHRDTCLAVHRGYVQHRPGRRPAEKARLGSRRYRENQPKDAGRT